MSSKVSKDSLIVAASILTIAEAIFGTPGPKTDYQGADNPSQAAYDSFKEHMTRLEADYLKSKDREPISG